MEGLQVSMFLAVIICFLTIVQGEKPIISSVENCTENGVTHSSWEQWSPGNCTICNCTAGYIECRRTSYRVDYGLFEINGMETCRSLTCNVSSFLTRDATEECKAFSKALSSSSGLFTCSDRRSFIKNDHRCNGYEECPDGSDETGCEKRICKDENGVPVLEKTWKPSECVTCSCIAGIVNCTREIAVFTAAISDGSFTYTINCRQPGCELRTFLNDASVCEVYEVIEGSNVMLRGEEWVYKGCTFVFDVVDDEPGTYGHSLPGPVCYLRRGAIWCDKSCPVLSELVSRLRWSEEVKLCVNKFLLAHDCKSVGINRLYRRPRLRKSTRATSCRDEAFATYSEGAVWRPDYCTKCECRNTTIRCTRTILRIDQWYSSIRNAIVQQCQQPNCNVTLFISNARGICRGCKWKHRLFGQGTHWNESGIDFHCMARERVISGCYVYSKSVKCTGAFAGLRNLSLLSDGKMFLCKSGDEVWDLSKRCNVHRDCSDGSDERDCVYVCPEQKYLGLSWKPIPLGSSTWQSCSAINGTFTGSINVQCNNNWLAPLTLKVTNCSCRNEQLYEYFVRKIVPVSTNNTWEMSAIARELMDSYVNFANENNYYYLVSTLARHRVSLPYPETEKEDNDTAVFFEKINECLYKLPRRWGNRQSASLCELEQKNYPSHKDPNLIIAKEIYRFRQKSPNYTKTYNLRKSLQPVTEGMTLQTFTGIEHVVVSKTVMKIAPLPIAIKIPVMSGYRNNTLVKNQMPEERNASTTRNCSKILKRETSKSNEETGSRSRDTVELVLVCLSTAVIFASLITLSLSRVKRSEKNFLHKNLLLSMGLGYLTYILDTTAFGSRRNFLVFCSVWAVIRHYLSTAVFTWMLAEGVKLCIVLVKVFPTKKKYVMYLLIGWGLPAVIVAIVAAIKPEAYIMKTTTTEEIVCAAKIIKTTYPLSCWLQASSWYYKGPVAAILAVNFIIFAIVLRIIFGTISTKYSNDKVAQTKKGIKGVAALLPLLGVTWIFGFTVDLHESLAYIFILLSSTQGIVFGVVHCALDDEVRASVKTLVSGSKSSSFKETSSRTNTTPVPPQQDHSVAIATGNSKAEDTAL